MSAARRPARPAAAPQRVRRRDASSRAQKPRAALPAIPAPAALGLVLLAAVALHQWVLRAPFFADDYLFLDQVRHRSLPAALVSPDPIGNFFRPVGRQAWFWLAGRVSGQSPGPFHALDLGVFLAALALLFALVRRVAGVRAGVVAAAFVALHSAADVPLGWCAGSQDLLAVTGALGALLLHVTGRRIAAAACLLLALLSKESVFAVPGIAILLDRCDGEPWRAPAVRAWPLFAATGVWAVALGWIAASRHHALGGGIVSASPAGIPAALAHLVQTAAGAEWRTGAVSRVWTTAPPWPVVLTVLAVLATPALPGHGARADAPAARSRRGLLLAGGAWAVLGALPVAAVIAMWSGYYYLFAMCGVALALGVWCADRSRIATAAVVVLLAWGSQIGRTVDEFQTSPNAWSTTSHVNRFYLDRALPQLTRTIDALKRVRPTLPRNATVFFGSLPQFAGFQAGDGPLVRWAYRDSSLRSYFISGFSKARAARGPVVILVADAGSLHESDNPEDLMAIGISSALTDHPELGRDLLRYSIEQGATKRLATYAIGVVSWMCADTTGAAAAFADAAVALAPGPAPGLPAARALAAAGDTLNAIGAMLGMLSRHGLDPELHAALAELCLTQPSERAMASLECLASTILAPRDPMAWRRLAFLQLETRHFNTAGRSLERYVELGGPAARDDIEAMRALKAMRELAPGGRITQEALRGRAVIDLTR